MKLSRTDVVPVLTIVAGGVVGVLLTFSPLVLWSPAEDVPAPVPAWSPSKEVSRPARPVTGRFAPTWSSDGQTIVFRSSNDGRAYWVSAGGGEPQPVQISPDGEWVEYQPDESGKLTYLSGKSIRLILESTKGAPQGR
jgi:hypothetical protein